MGAGEQEKVPEPEVRATLTTSHGKSHFWWWTGLSLILFFGLARAWIGRYSINPDAISYLDLSDAFLRRDWHNFVNAYWSPLYPIFLGIGRLVLPTSKHWELPSVHIVNFAIFVGALGCFEFFYSALRDLLVSTDLQDDTIPVVGEWPFFILAHVLFLWISLDLISVWDVSPDLLVSGFVYSIAGMILRFHQNPSWKLAAALGALLGAAYWAKAVLFPLGFAFMACALMTTSSIRTAVKRGLVMATVFSAVAGPWVAALSLQKHRFTFGDTGRLAYAILVSPGGATRNWQGDPASGKPAHPTRQVYADPPVYEFAEPIAGTFPPWFDSTYWQEGRVAQFNLKAQVAVTSRQLLFYAEMLLHQENALLATALTFFLITGRKRTGQTIARNWPILLMAAAAFAIYMLVHAEPRYLGPYIGLLWLALLSPLRIPRHLVRVSGYLMCVAASVLLLSVVDNTARAVRDGGPYSAMQEIILSDHLDAMGLRPGDHIGVVGGVGLYAARFSRAKIVVEVIDASAFWQLTPEKRGIVLQRFSQAGARMVIAPDPSPCPAPDSSWIKIRGEPYYARRL